MSIGHETFHLLNLVKVKSKWQKKNRVVDRQTKQVTWGHNIVADGWAGASNPRLTPTTPPTPFQHTHPQTKSTAAP